ncbi:MAG: bifunctional UDP-N-acetylglucosamine diphosphorylase/glucosamine-1-phosphate N-acetyltransferase GlmU [Clostridia bacterium]|nr:bifunctional UDP-N-acetylglucosamine diphosphorylase/glucosamine-1-phosphate N-acetyltransferase GlmU [Clostridia bacterium]
MNSTAIVLAAGQGTRMKSKIPKVLHGVVGKPMLGHVLDALTEAGIKRKIVVLGHGAPKIEQWLPADVEVVYQRQQLGTGHAVLQAKELLKDTTGPVLVVCGDTPLLRASTLKSLLAVHTEADAKITVLTANVANPKGYGRIIRENNKIKAIVEEKDASPEEKAITEINTGSYCFQGDFLGEYLDKLNNENAQGEYYLTDLIKLAVQDNLKVEAFLLEDIKESLGINNRIQLAEAEQIFRMRILEDLMLAGVTIIDPHSTYIQSTVQVGMDTVIYPGTILEGQTTIGENCVIGPGVRITDSIIGNHCQIQNSVLVESKVDIGCRIGPFAYLRAVSVSEDNYNT